MTVTEMVEVRRRNDMKITAICEDMLLFDNGTTMSNYHKQECCESHWADFSIMAGYNLNTITGKVVNILEVEFDENIKDSIELVEDAGFNLIAKDGSKYFIPCYAENNGCYNTNLTLIISRDNQDDAEIDITKCQKWDED
jgi:hypothetical protein